jgi:hypothetical protein
MLRVRMSEEGLSYNWMRPEDQGFQSEGIAEAPLEYQDGKEKQELQSYQLTIYILRSGRSLTIVQDREQSLRSCKIV